MMSDIYAGAGRRKSPTTNRLSKNEIKTEVQPEHHPDSHSGRQHGMEIISGESGISIGHEIETTKHCYVITREIVNGQMTRVFEVKRLKDDRIFALKVHPPSESNKLPPLRHEAHIYQELYTLSKKLSKNEIRFLNIYDYGECSEGCFLFITLAGESLASFLSDEKVPTCQTALDWSLQMLNALEQFHQLGFVHRRIRFHTWVTGIKPRDRYNLHLISFSFACMANSIRSEVYHSKISSRNFDRHAPRVWGIPGQSYTRKDDLESWFYLICDLFHPSFLPWWREKRLNNSQIGEMKDKLMKGDFYYRYTVMPKTFQAIAGAINETDAKMPNYMFLRECLMEEVKLLNSSFGCPWTFRPTADNRADFEYNRYIQHPTAFNFGAEKSRTILPDDVKDAIEMSTVQIVYPHQSDKQGDKLLENAKDVAAANKRNATEISNIENEKEDIKLQIPSQSCSSHTIQGISPGYRPPAASGSDTSIHTISTDTLTRPPNGTGLARHCVADASIKSESASTVTSSSGISYESSTISGAPAQQLSKQLKNDEIPTNVLPSVSKSNQQSKNDNVDRGAPTDSPVYKEPPT